MDLFKTIWRVTGRQQIVLIVLSLVVAGLAAVPLDYQKEIINGLSGGLTAGALLRLGAELMGVIFLSLALKWALGYQASIVGESVIKRIRSRIYTDYSNASTDGAAGMKAGTLVTMLSAEAEDMGKFVGSAFSEPFLQLGTLIGVIGYIGATQPRLGALALLIILPQAIIVLATQRHINARVSERVIVLRRATNQITQAQSRQIEQAVLDDFDAIYETRRKIFIWKLSTKFALSGINGAGTVGILMLGGWLVIEGRSDVGTVVAATVGLGRLQQPWSQLIAYYRNVSAIRVKFELLREALDRMSGDKTRGE